MRYYRVGGYNGPVQVLNRDGADVARAACRSVAQKDYDGGSDRWVGELRGVTPAGVVGGGGYRLRFPDGATGDVTIRLPAPDSVFRYFEGTAGHPPTRR